MDFGIKASMLVGLHVYQQASRCSGRTNATLARISDGDVLLVFDGKEAKRLCGELKRRGKTNVQVISMDSFFAEPERYRGRRIVADHTFFERYYLRAIEDAASYIRHMLPDDGKLDGKNPPDWIEPVANFDQLMRDQARRRG